MNYIKKFNNFLVSEKLNYHLDNNISVVENVFRPGSDSFLELIKEARLLFESGDVIFSGLDRYLFECTDLGKFIEFDGLMVPLDLPMETVEEMNEAEYHGREVKLNHPMRGGTKKYHVYVKNPKTGKVKKIAFGDVHGGLTAKVNDPDARKSFVARHKCKRNWKPSDKLSAAYWSCRLPKFKLVNTTYSGYW